ncbi:hypothetical protein C8R43DRAFT_1041075 [Mycena crocata]|nr:hypothetical protein C8R43DRAFT_1041075 [Mycena crocata]
MYIPLPQLGSFITFDVDVEETVSAWDLPPVAVSNESSDGRSLTGFVGWVTEVNQTQREYLCIRVHLLTVDDPGILMSVSVEATSSTTDGHRALALPNPLPWTPCFVLSESVALLGREESAAEPPTARVAIKERVRCKGVFWDDKKMPPRERGNRVLNWFRQLLHLKIDFYPDEWELDVFNIWNREGVFPVIKNVSNQLPASLRPRDPADLISMRDRIFKLSKEHTAAAIERARRVDETTYGTRENC